MLFKQYPALKNSTDTAMLADAIKNLSEELTLLFTKELTSLINELSAARAQSKKKFIFIESACSRQLAKKLTTEWGNNIIAKAIDLEYEARTRNKALLWRGTSYEKFQVGIGESNKKILAGSTLRIDEKRDNSIEKAYGQKEIAPYSISFGNSLLGGALRDCGACAYHYLVKEEELMLPTGYALLVDKNAYFQHQNQNLFFIPALGTLAAFFEAGEYFHPRTKAAIFKKKAKTKIFINGLQEGIQDPTGVILITRDPLKHAALFSEFLAENGRFIQKGDESTFSDEEKKFAKNVADSQKKASEFYKNIRNLDTKIRPLQKAFKAKKGIKTDYEEEEEESKQVAASASASDLVR
jgi:hypothetical protein